MNYELWREITCKSFMEVKDIMKLESCCQKTAQGIMQKCRILFGGEVKFNKHRITTDSYLQYTGMEKGSYLKLLEIYQKGTIKDEEGKDTIKTSQV